MMPKMILKSADWEMLFLPLNLPIGRRFAAALLRALDGKLLGKNAPCVVGNEIPQNGRQFCVEFSVAPTLSRMDPV